MSVKSSNFSELVARSKSLPSIVREVIAVAAGFGLLSFLVGGKIYWITNFMVFCIFVLSYDLLYGYMGYLSFGHMLYYGTGAYATGMWLSYVHSGFFTALFIGVLASAILAGLAGLVCIRTSGASFALLNMAFNEIGFFAIRSVFSGYTHGDDGLICSTPPLLGRLDLSRTWPAFSFALVVLLVVFCLLMGLTRSPCGILIRSLKENETRVRFLGYPVQYYKWITFVIASTLAGLAGAVFCLIQGFISPDVISPFGNIDVIIAVLIGGAGCLYGALAGGVAFMLIKNYLSLLFTLVGNILPFPVPQWDLWLGVVLLLIVFAWPQGIVGFLRHKIRGLAEGGSRSW
jgi:branched-chain amino acid transport system permease protein